MRGARLAVGTSCRLGKIICVSLLLGAQILTHGSACAQVTQRHNCWDIDVTVPADGVPPVYVVSEVDTGLMLVALAKEYIGTPYRYGGRTPKGFDCAGFAHFLYKQFGHDLPGWSGAQATLGTEVRDTRNLLPGDLVFFGARHNKKFIGHTGIVVSADPDGTFRFIHASTTNGVIISRSAEEYYATRYITARRLLQ